MQNEVSILTISWTTMTRQTKSYRKHGSLKLSFCLISDSNLRTFRSCTSESPFMCVLKVAVVFYPPSAAAIRWHMPWLLLMKVSYKTAVFFSLHLSCEECPEATDSTDGYQTLRIGTSYPLCSSRFLHRVLLLSLPLLKM